MANLIGQGTVVQISAASITIRPNGLNVEQTFTVNRPIDPNILPGASVVFFYDDGSCDRSSPGGFAAPSIVGIPIGPGLPDC